MHHVSDKFAIFALLHTNTNLHSLTHFMKNIYLYLVLLLFAVGCNKESIEGPQLFNSKYLEGVWYISGRTGIYTFQGDTVSYKYDENVILVHLWDLKANDLVDKISAEEYERLHRIHGNIRLRHSQNLFLYKRNRFGGELLNFIIKGMPKE